MTLISTTLQPSRTFDADPAELESLTRQGLVVGVARPPGPAARPDPVVAYVSTTINPGVVIGVDDAELESLTRQHLIAHTYGANAPVFAGAATGGGAAHAPGTTESNPPAVSTPADTATGVGAARNPTVKAAVSAGAATGTGAAYGAIQTTGYGVGGYGTQPYGV